LSDHTTALVPLESWCYNSPELRIQGKTIDVGLLCESLIYYDTVVVNITNQPQLAELLSWFINQNKYDDFIALVNYGIIKVYEYSFASMAINNEGVYSLINIQDSIQAKPNTFEQRFLYHNSVESVLKGSRKRKKLYKALRENIIEVKADEFGAAIENARKDWECPHRNSLLVQAFVDELYRVKNIGRSPEITSHVETTNNCERHHISYNVNFDELSNLAGEDLNFHNGTPLTASAISNRLIWSASELQCDLYLGRPLSILVGDKLFESGRKIDKTHSIIETLEEKVEFPDIRKLINDGSIGLDEVLFLRKKAKKFRDWLQIEGEKDRDAIISYHHEVAQESGFTKTARNAISIFGVIGGAGLGSAVGSVLSGPEGAAIGGASGSAAGYVMDVASKLGSGWKPVVFGNWYRDRISKVLEKK